MTVVARVSEIDYKKGFVKVILTDRDNIVSDWLPMMSYEYEMPKVGDHVSCNFTDDSCHTGLCKGRYFNDKYLPKKFGKDIYYKELLEDAEIVYNRATKELMITVDNFSLVSQKVNIIGATSVSGDVTISGDLIVNGDVIVDGDITATGSITPFV